MGIYASDGSIRVTEVTGSTLTGLYAPDGSLYVVESPGTSFVGAHHPCGAYWITVVTSSSQRGLRAPDGSLYVSMTPFIYPSAGIRVTDVAGTIGINLTAPVLTWTSLTTDTTPEFDVDLTAPEVADVITLEYDDNSDFSSAIDTETNIVDSGEASALLVNFVLGALADGTYYFRAKHARGASVSAWSNTETVTIAATSAEAQQFLDRATGMDATHNTAFTTLIDSLVTNGIWAKLDALYIFATDTSAHALLNVKSTSFVPTLVNAPTFTADRGFTGNGTSSYVDSNFNPTTSGGQFTQNSACFGAWSLTTATAAGSVVDAGWISTNGTFVRCKALSGSYSGRVNQGTSDTFAVADGAGLFSVNRSASNATQHYRNASSLGTSATVSTAQINHSLCFGTSDGTTFSPRQWAGGFVSSSLNGTEQTNLYNAMLAYMQAVGAA